MRVLMLVGSVAFICLGLVIIRLINLNHRAHFVFKGKLFRNIHHVMLMEISCFLLFISGSIMMTFFPLSIRIAISVALVLLLLSYVRKWSDSAIAHKIIRIYKTLKCQRPESNEQDVLKETANQYLKGIGTDEAFMNSYLTGLFPNTRDPTFVDELTIRGVIGILLSFHNDLSRHQDYLNLLRIREKAVETACAQEGVAQAE
jgi:hypothetical protein